MVRKFPWKVPGKSEMQTIHSTENSGNSWREIKWNDQKFSKIWVYLARSSSFQEIPENAVPFASGNLW